MHDALKEAQFAPDRPVTRLLHDSPEMRVVVFGLEAGQEVPPHTVPVRVLMHVLQGKGVFLTGKGEEPAYPGAIAVTAPNEPHGLKAVERTVMLAIIAPRP
jgi:quercetin dioxygenase-like cupin family protein